MKQQPTSKNNPVEKAVASTRGGVVINIHISTQSKETCFPADYNKWRNTIETKVTNPAKNNQANKELLRQIAIFFGVDEKSVSIVKGLKSSSKTILLKGKRKNEVIRKLATAL